MESLFRESVEQVSETFGLEEEDTEVLEDAERAASELLVPELEHYLERRFNEEVPRVLSSHDLLGIPIDESYGGRGRRVLTYALAMQRLGQLGLGVATFLDVQTSLCCLTLERWGSEDVKERYLEPAVRGDLILSFALTEPEAGSNPLSLKTEYREEGDGYYVSGVKDLITNGSVADALIVFGKPEGEDKPISAFLVDSDSDGFEVSMKLEEKMGLFTSDTALLEFDECHVPKENTLGDPDKGWAVAYSALVNGRLGVAAACLGVIDDCLNAALERSRERVQHGKEIGKHQLVQRQIAEIAMNRESARWPTYWACVAKEREERNPGDRSLREEVDQRSALAKRLASRCAFESADMAVQLHGGFGYSLLSSASRHLVDSRVARIYEGTDEILDLKIASSLLGEGFEAYR